MPFDNPIHPRRVLAALDTIDMQWRDPAAQGWRRPAAVLLVAALCLFGIHYLKFSATLHELVRWLSGPGGGMSAWLAGPWGALSGQLWWGLVHAVGYVLVPLLFIRFGLRRPLRDMGLTWGATTPWLGWCAALAAPIVLFAFVASFTDSFQHTYPFYRLAGRSWVDLLLWEAIYLSQFVFLEFFFRGFLLHALAPRFGALAVFVMVVPYLMIHFPKPWAEAFGALPFGILLGVIALRSRSIWGGAFVHMTIAVSMDLMSLAQTGRWPMRWVP